MSQQKPHPTKLDWILHFPKHKGKSLRWCIENDLDWVKWLHKNEKIIMHPDAFDYLLEVVGTKSHKTINTSSIRTRHSKNR